MKKQTHWITIPDEILHTPVSGEGEGKGKKEKTGDSPVKNKIFWGVGFAILIVAVFALLAPSQFSSLLKGSLFDTAGVSEDDLKIELVPEKKTESDLTATETTDGATTDGTENTSEETAVEETTVAQPEEEPVSISVTPISTTTEAEDCGTDTECLLNHLKDCSLAKGTLSYKVSDKDFETSLEITGSESDNCLMTASFTKSPDASVTDKTAECKLAKGDYKKEDIEKIFSVKTELTSTCTGTGADALGAYLDSLSTATGTTATTATVTGTDEQAKLIADLQKQINDLQEEQEKNLASANGSLYPSAGTTVPTSITSTTTIGQPSTLQPSFRTNPYKVSMTPQQVLQQNTGLGGQYASQVTGYQTSGYQTTGNQLANQNQTSYYQNYQTSGATPQTGPSEVLLIAFAVTFLALVGWRFVRSFT